MSQQQYGENTLHNISLLICRLMYDGKAKENGVVAQNLPKLKSEHEELCSDQRTGYKNQNRNDWNRRMKDLGIRIAAIFLNTAKDPIGKINGFYLTDVQRRLCRLVFGCSEKNEFFELFSTSVDNPEIREVVDMWKEILWRWLQNRNYGAVNKDIENFNEILKKQMEQQAQQSPELLPIDQQEL